MKRFEYHKWFSPPLPPLKLVAEPYEIRPAAQDDPSFPRPLRANERLSWSQDPWSPEKGETDVSVWLEHFSPKNGWVKARVIKTFKGFRSPIDGMWSFKRAEQWMKLSPKEK